MPPITEQLACFEVLVRQHERMLLAYVLAITPDFPLAQDIVQDSFVVAFRKITTLEDKSKFAPWLRQIARFRTLNVLKARGREIPFEPEVFEGMEDIFGALDQNDDVELWENRAAIVTQCFEKLPPKLKEACQLHYFDGRATSDIAQNLGVNLAAVLKRLERARDSIRDCVRCNLDSEPQPKTYGGN